LNEIKSLLRDLDLDMLEFEIIQANDPSESPANTLLYDLIASVVKEFDPSCSVAPIMLTGGTDSRFFRKIGTVSYGFQPLLADMNYGEMSKSIHGIDERVSIQNLVFGTSVLYNVVERFMT
jgi:acetylornithine deacetylase/succinyl-diaminopimelate desuccinylase-like protein